MGKIVQRSENDYVRRWLLSVDVGQDRPYALRDRLKGRLLTYASFDECLRHLCELQITTLDVNTVGCGMAVYDSLKAWGPLNVNPVSLGKE